MAHSTRLPEATEVRGKKRRRSELSDVSSTVSARSNPLDNSEGDEDAVTPATPTTPRSPSAKGNTNGVKVHVCTFEGCDKAFNRPARLEEHLRSHTNTRSYRCSYTPCTKTFLRQSHLAHHIKSAHTDIRDYECTWAGCTKRFSTGTRLRRHLAVHEGREKHRCTNFPPCNQTFRKHVTLQKHIDIEHLCRKPFRCNRIDAATGELCDHGYFTSGKLEAHIARWHDSIQRYWCAECSSKVEGQATADPDSIDDTSTNFHKASFSTLGELRDHMQSAHPPHCPECALIFSRPSELARHIDTVHSPTPLAERRTHACEHIGCEARFTKRSNLSNHVRTVHAAVKPFVCGATDLSNSKDTAIAAWDRSHGCSAAFTSKAGLQSHVRTQHLRGPLRPKRDSEARRAPSALARLTGVAYEQEGGGGIACPRAPGCDSVFVTFADVEAHALAKHGMPADEVAGDLAEREALSGGVFWLGGAVDVDEGMEQAEQMMIDPLLQYLHPPGLDAGDNQG